ncbi:MAG: dihydrolipoamide acetyltransferase family protein, partial [Chloroflexota bacterium]|nr:dihydrolipoamide acetyltransferase family protein [Chloroflexota bacterium]
ASIPGSGVGGRILRSDVEQAAAAAAPTAPAGPVKASPAAKRLAREHDLDLATVNGTGPGGRIVTEDVEAALASAAEAPAVGAAEGETVPYRGMRRTIGGRMHASLQEMAQLTMAMDADMTRAVDLRRELLDLWADRELRPTYTDFAMKAAALALRAHPRLNAELRDEEIVLHPQIHVGFAVALDEGLIVPVTRDTDALPLDELAPISADLAARARERRLGPDDLTGGTFTVTTLGMYGVDVFTPIINPPQAAILGVGRISDRPVFRGEGGTDVERRSFMTLSLTIDHRVVDGAPAAEFLRDVKGILERPSQLILP